MSVRLHHVSLLVADTGRALAFWRDLVGLAPLPRPDLGYPGAWLDLGGGQQLHLIELPSPDPAVGRPAHVGRDRHLALWVDDLDAWETRLAGAGVACTRSRSGRRALFCRDPDGNGLELIERPA